MAGDPRDQQRLYGDLAWTWPIVSPPEEYVSEAEGASDILSRHSPFPVRTLLHLGCGGGHLDWTLKRRFAVTGVDVSDAMLAMARQLNPEVTYLEGDMRTIRLGQTFDAVAVFDSINYMLVPGDLQAAFETAFLHLRTGGVFVTYAEETVERFRQNRTRVSTRSLADTGIVLVENAYDPDPRDTTFENAFLYLIRRGGELEVETDRHLCGLFPLGTWLLLLRQAGFEVRLEEPGPEGEDYPWFVCIKLG